MLASSVLHTPHRTVHAAVHTALLRSCCCQLGTRLILIQLRCIFSSLCSCVELQSQGSRRKAEEIVREAARQARALAGTSSPPAAAVPASKVGRWLPISMLSVCLPLAKKAIAGSLTRAGSVGALHPLCVMLPLGFTGLWITAEGTSLSRMQATPKQAAAKAATAAEEAAAAEARQEAREWRLWGAYSLAAFAYISKRLHDALL